MAARFPTPQHCIPHSRFTKDDDWLLYDLSLSLNGNIAVTGWNVNTGRTCIDVYTIVRHSDSRDRPKIFFSKEFEKFSDEISIYRIRRVAFIDDDALVSCLGDNVEVFQVNTDELLISRKVSSEAMCLSVRERSEIFIGFHQSSKITVYDVTDLNEIKSINLQGIQNGDNLFDMAVIANSMFICVGPPGEAYNQRPLIFEEKNGKMLSELTKPTDTEQWYVSGLALNKTLNVVAVVWSQTFGGARKWKDLVVFYSPLNENNCSFLAVNIEFSVARIRISDRGDRIIMRDWDRQECKVYDMSEFFSYGHLKENLQSQLQEDDCLKLTGIFDLPDDQRDEIFKSDKPAEILLLALEGRGVIQPSNVDRLVEAFTELGIKSSCSYLVDFYQKTRPTPYGRLLGTLSAYLTASLPADLCRYFDISDEKKSSITSSPDPGMSLLLALDEIGIINPSEVEALEQAFSELKLVQAETKINEYQLVIEEEKNQFQRQTELIEADMSGKTMLSAETTISNDGGSLQIENTDIKLIIPPDALGINKGQCLVRMRVIPPGSHAAVPSSFSSHSSTVLELLPNNLRFQQPVELTLPHCLKLKKDAEYKAKIFMSHHEGDVEPRWEEVTDHHYILHDKACTLWLNKFCWTKYEIDDEIVEAKRIQVYTAAEPICVPDDIAEIEVGYHLDLPGAGEILRLNPRLIVGQRRPFLFLREGNHPLRVFLQKIRPPSWKYIIPEENPKEIPFRSVASSIDYSCPFLLEQEKESCNIPTCIFKASQNENHFQLFIRPKTIKTPTHPTSSHATAEVQYQENMTTGLDEERKHSVESLCKKESKSANLSSLNMTHDSVGEEPAVFRTRDEKENCVSIGDTGAYQPLKPHVRSNETHKKQQIDGIHQGYLLQYSGQQPERNHLLIQKYHYSQHFNMTPIPAGTFGGLYGPHEPHWCKESDEHGTIFIKYSTLLSIARKLDTPDPLFNDWRMLAGKLGFTAEDIAMFERDRSPTCSVITCALRRRKLTSHGHLKLILAEMKRKDAAECIPD